MSRRLPAEPPVLSGYSYVRPLGTGGFADVFLYGQQLPRRQVAVKALLRSVVDADVVRMFNAEADVMALLSAHPHILTVHEASISSDGRPYLVMEYCPGSYGARYRRERIPVEEVLDTGVKISSALETAHRTGLLHRDIKPSNILLTSFGVPVLSDFGIAMALSGSQRTEVAAMSIPWSAPEIVAERELGTVASEVWSLAATVYTLLAGHSPFEATAGVRDDREQLKRRIERARYTPVHRPDMHPYLDKVLERGMSRDPRRRHASMAEFAADLQQAQRHSGLYPTPLGLGDGQWDPAAASVDFNDAALRGPVISQVPSPGRRRASANPELAGLADTTTYENSLRNQPLATQVRGWSARIALGAVIMAGILGAAYLLLNAMNGTV